MDQEWMIRRRRIGQEDLLLIRGLIGAEGQFGRSHLSHRLCEIWDWRQANGRFRQIACRDLLRQLERKGLVKLPALLHGARRIGYRNVVPAGDLLEQVPLEGSLALLRQEIQVSVVQGAEQARLFKGLVGAYHYLGCQQAQVSRTWPFRGNANQRECGRRTVEPGTLQNISNVRNSLRRKGLVSLLPPFGLREGDWDTRK